MDPFWVIALNVEEAEIPRLEALSSKVHEGKIVAFGLSHNRAFSLLARDQALDF